MGVVDAKEKTRFCLGFAWALATSCSGAATAQELHGKEKEQNGNYESSAFRSRERPVVRMLLVAMPGAPSSVLAPSSKARSPYIVAY